MGSRLPPIPRDQLSSKGQSEYDEFDQLALQGFGQNGEKFIYKDNDGAFVGPYTFFQAAAETGKLLLETVFSFGKLPLPAEVKETAILTCGGHYRAAYETYAHSRVAVKDTGLSKQQVDDISQGRKPDNLSETCSIAYDVAKYLCSTPGPLPQHQWDECINAFGKDGTVALVHYIGFYAYTCIVLNAADVPVPE